jgi:hypothetical protein
MKLKRLRLSPDAAVNKLLNGCVKRTVGRPTVSIHRQIIEDGRLTTLRQINALWRFVR